MLLSRYGVSVIPYTESAAVTTSVTSLSNALRGTGNWVSYLLVNGQPWWRLGHWIATGAAPVLLTGLAAGLGLAGLLRPRLPARRFLLCLLLTGLLLMCAGHVTGLGNPLAGPVQHLINGPAAALRNFRKFDPLIRLPIALGLAHLLASVRLPRPHAVLAAAAALAIGGLTLPAYIGGLAVAGDFRQVPPYWVSAANWLNRHAGRQAVLVVPGAAFGQYLWGSPLDDVLQPLTSADWAERDLSLIGSPGNERLLDAIDQRLAAGAGSAALTQVLARMGVRYVLVRNDLGRPRLNGAWPARISQALTASPGITRVAQFGAPVGTGPAGDAAAGFDPPYPPVQIYQVAGAQPVATVQPAAGTLRVYGAPEALFGPFRLPCGLGPMVELNGRTLATRVKGTFAELLGGQPMPFTACPRASIAAGANRVFEPARDGFDVQDVVLAVRGGVSASGTATGAARQAAGRRAMGQ